MPLDDRSPGPLDPARESSHPTVCGKPTHAGQPCVLRTEHPGPHEHLRKVSVYHVGYSIEPAGPNDQCDVHYGSLGREAWVLVLSEARNRSDNQFLICRTCASEIARIALAMPNGPAPDPSETGSPDDWRPAPPHPCRPLGMSGA